MEAALARRTGQAGKPGRGKGEKVAPQKSGGLQISVVTATG
jgi:hypothetical protein